MEKKANGSDVWKGLAAGLVAGAVGAWAMDRFQASWSKLSESLAKRREDQTGHAAQEQGQADGEQEPATVKTASALSRRLFHHELTDQEKKLAGPATHYAFGTAMGGLYGTLTAITPQATRAMGLPFGAALWLVADEGVVPALGLGEPPTKTPVSLHVYALVSHLVYGLTTELVRRAVLRVW